MFGLFDGAKFSRSKYTFLFYHLETMCLEEDRQDIFFQNYIKTIMLLSIKNLFRSVSKSDMKTYYHIQKIVPGQQDEYFY